MTFALFLLYHVVLSLYGGWGGWWWYSQRLLGLNPTTVLVVLLLGLWLLFGCDNINWFDSLFLGAFVESLVCLRRKLTNKWVKVVFYLINITCGYLNMLVSKIITKWLIPIPAKFQLFRLQWPTVANSFLVFCLDRWSDMLSSIQVNHCRSDMKCLLSIQEHWPLQ